MLFKTRGIVLNYIKYGETSIITKIYTEAFGLQSYIQNGVRCVKGKGKMSLFQPLTLLDLVVYNHEGRDINRISEVSCLFPYRAMQTEYLKIAITGFLSEVLLKCLTEKEQNQPLFSFLYQSFMGFDAELKEFKYFHIFFLVQLMYFLGFRPDSLEEFFDQLEEHGINKHSDNENVRRQLQCFLENKEQITTDHSTNTATLDLIINFYQIHIEKFGELKSLRVLREL